ncbi:BatD family protein [Hydrogenimonas sp.]
MRTPGKIFWWLTAAALAWGGVRLSVNENPVIAGESVEMTIEAEGDVAEIPDIESIGGYPVTTEGMQRLERMEGNRSVVKWVKYYAFTPKKSVRIPPVEVVVDGKTYRTEPLGVRVLPKKALAKDDFSLELLPAKEEAYVGEPVAVTVRFREKRGVPVMNVDFVPIKYENFWVKQAGRRKQYARGDYLVHEVRYLFFPQVEGNLTIGPARVKVAVTKKVRDAFGFIVRRPQWITFESKTVPLKVLSLPAGVALVGRFAMDLNATPRAVKAGEPVTVMLRVTAEGNIEDLEVPKLSIPGVTVYAEKPKLTQRYEHGRYTGEWVGRYTLVAEHSFTIPPVRIDYFDTTTRRVERLSSEPVAIRVEAAASQPEAFEETTTPREERNMTAWLYMNLAAAFAAGMGTMYLLMRFVLRRRKKATKNEPATTEAKMLQRLMPHISESKEAAQMAENLYAAMFEGKAVKVDKKAFERLMKELSAEC